MPTSRQQQAQRGKVLWRQRRNCISVCGSVLSVGSVCGVCCREVIPLEFLAAITALCQGSIEGKVPVIFSLFDFQDTGLLSFEELASCPPHCTPVALPVLTVSSLSVVHTGCYVANDMPWHSHHGGCVAGW